MDGPLVEITLVEIVLLELVLVELKLARDPSCMSYTRIDIQVLKYN